MNVESLTVEGTTWIPLFASLVRYALCTRHLHVDNSKQTYYSHTRANGQFTNNSHANAITSSYKMPYKRQMLPFIECTEEALRNVIKLTLLTRILTFRVRIER